MGQDFRHTLCQMLGMVAAGDSFLFAWQSKQQHRNQKQDLYNVAEMRRGRRYYNELDLEEILWKLYKVDLGKFHPDPLSSSGILSSVRC